MDSRIANILNASAGLTGLYFLAVMPRMAGRPEPAPFKTKLFAHRGLHDNSSDAPENSMPAFRKAVDKFMTPTWTERAAFTDLSGTAPSKNFRS